MVTKTQKRHLMIYCDESSSKGTYYSNFYGGAAINERKKDRIEASLLKSYTAAKIQGEVKWTKIGHGHVNGYISLMDTFFDHMAANEIKTRIMFTDNRLRARDLDEYQLDNQYFLLYYQFIKHAFGLQHYKTNSNLETHVQLLLDELPDNVERCNLMKDYMASLTKYPVFRESNIILKRENIIEIDSKKHIIAQCLDVVLGAMQFRLNDKHKEKPLGAKRRGKRTIAKEKVYKHINKRIRKLYPHFNIAISTGTKTSKDRWIHPYRHWCFIPSGATYKNIKPHKK